MRRAVVTPLLLAILSATTATANAAPTPDLALERYREALTSRGLSFWRQGAYFATLEDQPLLAHNVDCPYNPASVVKVATSAAALERFGPDYRYQTSFYTNGRLDPSTGVLVGDLIVVGSGDPSFFTENGFHVAKALREMGVAEITGNLVVKGRFYCNYSASSVASAGVLKMAMDEEKWTSGVQYAYGKYRVRENQHAPFESVKIAGQVVAATDTSVAGLTPLFTLNSAPLIKILKELNNFSNNWMAHRVGEAVGGPSAVEYALQSRFDIAGDQMRLQTTSGLGTNFMRPLDVATLLRGLVPRLSAKGYAPADLLPVAGDDPGTLDRRFLRKEISDSVIAKTGTLRGVSALAGYMYTRDRGIVVFSIMNVGGAPATFRPLQDLLVREMMEACGGPAPIPYARPVGYGQLAGAFIERAPGNIPAVQPEMRVAER